ncbi:MAG TPA: CPBP family intramembrane glutamic endopeptidase [Bacteroidota bacterium]|jgi:membrane protease YdiL (CAAX protease family)
MDDASAPPPVASPVPRKPLTDHVKGLPPIAFGLLSLGFLFISYQIVGGIAALLVVGLRPGPEDATAFRLATMFGQILFLLLPTLFLAKIRYGTYQVVRIQLPDWKILLATIVAVIALQQVLQAYMVLQDAIPMPDQVRRIVQELQDMMQGMYFLLIASNTPWEFMLVLLVAAITPAVCEEVLFRGLVQRSFEESIGGWQAAVLAGVIFGLFHLNPFSLVAVSALGIFFGLLVYRTRNLSLSIIAHVVNNALACATLYFFSSDDLYLGQFLGGSGTSFLWMNSLVFGVVFLSASSYFIYATKKPTADSEVQ